MDITYLFIEPMVSKFLFRKNREYECPYKHESITVIIGITQIHIDGHPPRTCSPGKSKTSNCWHACNTDLHILNNKVFQNHCVSLFLQDATLLTQNNGYFYKQNYSLGY